jgi:serine/threonine protein kinase
METEFSECAGMEVSFGSERARLGECLGEGAEGAVYEIEEFSDVVAKIFKRDKRSNKREKLEVMSEDSMISPEEQTEIPWTAWPIDLVSRPPDGSFLGYVMPYLDTTEYIDAQRYASQHLRWEDTSRRERYKPAINLVLTVRWLHENGYAIGDLSEQNIRVNNGTVTLIDCDSYSVEDSEFAGQMEAPRYTPPEGRGTTHEAVTDTDRFGVAVHVFQFLMAGFHPYQAVGDGAVEGPLPEAIEHGEFPYGNSGSRDLSPPPRAPEFARLPSSVRRGFEQCFSAGQNDPGARPSLKKWLAILATEGNFDLDGVDVGDATVEQTDRDRLGRNWQEKIRENRDSGQAVSQTDISAPPTAQTSGNARAETRGPEGESHWADGIRGDQAAQSSQAPDPGQQGAGQQSDNPPYPLYVLLAILTLLLIVVAIILTV